jgi:hypothetical protein
LWATAEKKKKEKERRWAAGKMGQAAPVAVAGWKKRKKWGGGRGREGFVFSFFQPFTHKIFSSFQKL